jgi:hypothetical protein
MNDATTPVTIATKISQISGWSWMKSVRHMVRSIFQRLRDRVVLKSKETSPQLQETSGEGGTEASDVAYTEVTS